MQTAADTSMYVDTSRYDVLDAIAKALGVNFRRESSNRDFFVVDGIHGRGRFYARIRNHDDGYDLDVWPSSSVISFKDDDPVSFVEDYIADELTNTEIKFEDGYVVEIPKFRSWSELMMKLQLLSA